jgi:hypothetical protein
VQAAGTQVGLCDWRPRCGRFSAVKIAATTNKKRKAVPEAVGAA